MVNHNDMKEIEIPFGAKDSELKGWEYTIPEGMEAEIKDGKIIVKEKKPELTDFEIAIDDLLYYCVGEKYTHADTIAVTKENSLRLLELAKKEICKRCTVGLNQYWKGREDARKEAEESATFHYPFYPAMCFHGGVCTNPFKDCINCPRQSNDYTHSTTSGTCKKEE